MEVNTVCIKKKQPHHRPLISTIHESIMSCFLCPGGQAGPPPDVSIFHWILSAGG